MVSRVARSFCYYTIASEIKIVITLPVEIERLARLVAVRSGKTPEDVLREAVENQARIAGIAIAETVKTGGTIDMNRVRQITRRVASKPLIDPRPAKEILDEARGKP
jgi:antitoxin VapB